jgi:hypothetical protein
MRRAKIRVTTPTTRPPTEAMLQPMQSDRLDQYGDTDGGRALGSGRPDDRDAGRRAREQDLLRELAEVTGSGTRRQERREKGRSNERADNHA